MTRRLTALAVCLMMAAACIPAAGEEGEPMDAWQYLQEQATDGKRLPELVDAFEQMCGMAISGVAEEDTLLLFETGEYDFTGKRLFWFSLVRQYPGGDGEFIQLRLDVTYTPTEETRRFLRTDWDEFVEGDFFAHVRTSAEYTALMDVQPVSIAVHQDET
ncbi:MAG: hypothetical protein ACI4MJ_12225 [Aristaeellaceae bacterium]